MIYFVNRMLLMLFFAIFGVLKTEAMGLKIEFQRVQTCHTSHLGDSKITAADMSDLIERLEHIENPDQIQDLYLSWDGLSWEDVDALCDFLSNEERLPNLAFIDLTNNGFIQKMTEEQLNKLVKLFNKREKLIFVNIADSSYYPSEEKGQTGEQLLNSIQSFYDKFIKAQATIDSESGGKEKLLGFIPGKQLAQWHLRFQLGKHTKHPVYSIIFNQMRYDSCMHAPVEME